MRRRQESDPNPESKAWVALELAVETYAPSYYLQEYEEVVLGKHPSRFGASI
jgi:hypothetical protein